MEQGTKLGDFVQRDAFATAFKEGKITNVEIKEVLNESDDVVRTIKFKEINTLPTKLVEGKNIFRGFAIDYSKPKITFKQFREGRIYELRKKYSGAELIEEIQKFDKRNLAYFDGKISNLKLDPIEIKISGNKYEGEAIFDAYKVDGSGNIGTEGAWSREFDTEYVGLSEIANKLGGKKGKVFPKIKGEMTIASELPYCVYCQGVIQYFADMFPNVKIYLVDGIKTIK